MKSRTLGGVLLVSGTTIGAGMLALPVLTGQAGFFPSLFLILGYWLISVYTALLMLEVNLRFEGDINLLTMTRKTFGGAGEVIAWIVYLLLLYALTAAYLSGSAPLISGAITQATGWNLSPWLQPFPALLVFGTVIYFGTKPVDHLNRWLMIGLIVAYVSLLSLGLPHIEKKLLSHFNPSYVWVALPVIVTSFGFQIIIPTLTIYLNRNVKALKKVIWVGSSLPLIVYLLWELVALGIIPLEGKIGLLETLKEGQSATYPLTILLESSWISLSARLFSFFAIVTSFLGVSLSLSDFLTDGFKIEKSSKGRLLALSLTFIPPLAFVLLYPHGFIMALQYAGAFVSILLGILPATMAWRGRKLFGKSPFYQVKGGPICLSAVIFFFTLVILIVLFNEKIA